jgi:hypothetical protein
MDLLLHDGKQNHLVILPTVIVGLLEKCQLKHKLKENGHNQRGDRCTTNKTWEKDNMSDQDNFVRTLGEMGINPAHLQSTGGEVLPPLPPSDPTSLQRNVTDGFYQRSAKEFWSNAQLSQHTVEDFKKCQHYFTKVNNELTCGKCHAGWVVPETFHVIDGKLYDKDIEIQFAP